MCGSVFAFSTSIPAVSIPRFSDCCVCWNVTYLVFFFHFRYRVFLSDFRPFPRPAPFFFSFVVWEDSDQFYRFVLLFTGRAPLFSQKKRRKPYFRVWGGGGVKKKKGGISSCQVLVFITFFWMIFRIFVGRGSGLRQGRLTCKWHVAAGGQRNTGRCQRPRSSFNESTRTKTLFTREKQNICAQFVLCFFSKFGKRASFFRFLSPRVSGAFLILTRLFLSKLPYPTLRQRISLLHWNWCR